MSLLDRRAQQFDMAGGILTTFPWIRYVAPEMSGYNILVTLNNELKSFITVRDPDVNSISASLPPDRLLIANRVSSFVFCRIRSTSTRNGTSREVKRTLSTCSSMRCTTARCSETMSPCFQVREPRLAFYRRATTREYRAAIFSGIRRGN